LEFEPGLTADQLSDAINAAETSLRAAVPIARVIYLEPDRYHEPSALG